MSGSNDSVANDFFCRRMAKHCDVIVLAVGYRLAPENRYPAACEDGFKVLQWLGKQANLAECNKSMGGGLRRGGGGGEVSKHVVDAFGASLVEPWLASHADPSRYAKPKSFHFALVSSEKVLFMIWYVCVCLPRLVSLAKNLTFNVSSFAMQCPFMIFDM